MRISGSTMWLIGVVTSILTMSPDPPSSCYNSVGSSTVLSIIGCSRTYGY